MWFLITLCVNFCRRSPISIAAAVIYIITQLSDDKKPLRGQFSCTFRFAKQEFTSFNCEIDNADVSVATGVAEGTIRNSYKDLYPHLPKIIPTWYAKEEDLKNLQSP